MATALSVVTTALERAGVIPTGQTVPNNKAVKGLELLNDWIADRKNDGLDFQLSTLASSDTVYLDASDLSCLKANLTVLVADHWKLPIPPTVRQSAEDLLDNVRGKYLEASLEEMELPDALVSQGGSDIRSGC
jgi:hypothetical protein